MKKIKEPDMEQIITVKLSLRRVEWAFLLRMQGWDYLRDKIACAVMK